jgi:hypothetical protein
MYRDTVARCLLLVHRCWTSLTPIATEGILFPTVVAYVSLLSVSFTSLRLAKHLVSLYYPEGAGPDQRYVTLTHSTLTHSVLFTDDFRAVLCYGRVVRVQIDAAVSGVHEGLHLLLPLLR